MKHSKLITTLASLAALLIGIVWATAMDSKLAHAQIEGHCVQQDAAGNLVAMSVPCKTFLCETVTCYPALIEATRQRIDRLSDACENEVGPMSAGMREWYAKRKSLDSCRQLTAAERSLERAQGEFKARLCVQAGR